MSTSARRQIHCSNNITTFAGVKDSSTLSALRAISQQTVDAYQTDGSVLSGTFSGLEIVQGEAHLILRYAFVKKGDPSALDTLGATERRGKYADRICLPVSQVIKMQTQNTNPMNRPRHDARSFATDGQISGRQSPGPGRELKKFDDFSNSMPVAGANVPGSRLSGKDAETFGDLRPAGKWDQFKVNQDKFGVTTSFDESQYTTSIDRSGADYAAREREAARIAAEIEGKVSNNIHMQEERNQRVQTDMDEEALYSGVQRPKSYPNYHSKYKPHQNGAPMQPKHARYQSASGPSKQDARPKNGGPTKAPQKSAIAPKAVWGAKNNPSKQNSNNKSNNNSKGASHGKPANNNKHAPMSNNKNFAPAGKASSPQAKTPSAPVTKPSPTPQTSKATNQVPVVKPVIQAKPSTAPGKRLSYAAALNARPARASAGSVPAAPAAQPASPVPNEATEGPKPPLSPISPSTAAPGKPPVGRMPPRAHASTRIPNGGRTPPGAPRTSPSVTRNSPSNPESSAMDALSLESPSAKIIKPFEQFKTKQVVKSMTENRQEITNDLKKFSTDLDAKRTAPRKTTGNAASPTAGVGKGDKQASGKNAEQGTNGNIMEASDGVNTTTNTTTITTNETEKTKQGEENSAPKKKKQLNPNASSFTPGGSSAGGAAPGPQPTPVPGGPAMPGSAPMPVGPGVDPYFPMANFSGVPVSPDHQLPPNFQMGPPVGYNPYTTMMVPGMPPQGIPYMPPGSRNPYVRAMGPPPFAISVPMVPGQGNQRTPNIPQYYMQGQAPISMQPVAGYPHHQFSSPHQPPTVAQPVVSPRTRRNSTSKGRGRQQNFDSPQAQQQWSANEGKDNKTNENTDGVKTENKNETAPAAGAQSNTAQ